MKNIYWLILIACLVLACNNEDDSYTENVTPEVIPEFRTHLSELNLFSGNLKDLNPSSKTFEYDLNSTLFSDYAHKQRLIALPKDETLIHDGNGLPVFPDNSLIAKTFYYYLDERDESLGKHIIETRVLIKINGEWETGNYKWNDSQTDAILDLNSSTIPVNWIDANGSINTIDYQIPSDTQCFTCHRTEDVKRPIGLKLRSLNFNVNGYNQLQRLIDKNLLEGLSNSSGVSQLPKWDDSISYTLEERARAYLDINCAHCHSDGGYCDSPSILRLDYETSLMNSYIVERKNSIINRMSSDFQVGITMPWIGTTVHHEEGIALVLQYLNSL